MADSGVGAFCVQRYREAVAHLHSERFDECIEQAKDNLNDPTLSRYYRMTNLLLIACAENDWYEGERYHRQAEYVWYTANRLTEEEDEAAQTALREVRGDLDDLAVRQEEDALDETDEDLLRGSDNEMDVDDAIDFDEECADEDPSEDPGAVCAPEDEPFVSDAEASLNRAAAAEEARTSEPKQQKLSAPPRDVEPSMPEDSYPQLGDEDKIPAAMSKPLDRTKSVALADPGLIVLPAVEVTEQPWSSYC